MRAASVSALLEELARVRVGRASELASALGISKPTLVRLVAGVGNQVCRMGRGRSIQYARTRSADGIGRRVAMARVSDTGEITPYATLHLLWGGEHWMERRDGTGAHFVGLPPALADMAPQGYVGRGFPGRFPELGLPPRILDWSDDQRLIALARRGEDCWGDLIVGDESLARFVEWTVLEASRDDYPALAQRSALGEAGSSAGGEHPKFGAFVGGRHVLVKFASADDSPVARRWRDLLWCEHTALETVRRAGLPASRTQIVDIGGARFLEVERFDRIGARGRRAVITLGSLADEYLGERDTWTAAAARLSPKPFSLPVADAAQVRWLDAFGQLTGNTDRHFGNLAFFVEGSGALRLAPNYDMLPMILAPTVQVVVERPFRVEPPITANLAEWADAARWAQVYWREVEASADLDPVVRDYAARALESVGALASRVSPGASSPDGA